MKFRCPHCQTTYRIRLDQVTAERVRTRCKHCGHALILRIRRPPTGPRKEAADGAPSVPDVWYYARGRKKMGPYALDAMRELIRAGSIGPNTLVWHTGMSAWAAAREIASLAPMFGALTGPPPPPPRATRPSLPRLTAITPGGEEAGASGAPQPVVEPAADTPRVLSRPGPQPSETGPDESVEPSDTREPAEAEQAPHRGAAEAFREAGGESSAQPQLEPEPTASAAEAAVEETARDVAGEAPPESGPAEAAPDGGAEEAVGGSAEAAAEEALGAPAEAASGEGATEEVVGAPAEAVVGAAVEEPGGGQPAEERVAEPVAEPRPEPEPAAPAVRAEADVAAPDAAGEAPSESGPAEAAPDGGAEEAVGGSAEAAAEEALGAPAEAASGEGATEEGLGAPAEAVAGAAVEEPGDGQPAEERVAEPVAEPRPEPEPAAPAARAEADDAAPDAVGEAPPESGPAEAAPDGGAEEAVGVSAEAAAEEALGAPAEAASGEGATEEGVGVPAEAVVGAAVEVPGGGQPAEERVAEAVAEPRPEPEPAAPAARAEADDAAPDAVGEAPPESGPAEAAPDGGAEEAVGGPVEAAPEEALGAPAGAASGEGATEEGVGAPAEAVAGAAVEEPGGGQPAEERVAEPVAEPRPEPEPAAPAARAEGDDAASNAAGEAPSESAPCEAAPDGGAEEAVGGPVEAAAEEALGAPAEAASGEGATEEGVGAPAEAVAGAAVEEPGGGQPAEEPVAEPVAEQAAEPRPEPKATAPGVRDGVDESTGRERTVAGAARTSQRTRAAAHAFDTVLDFIAVASTAPAPWPIPAERAARPWEGESEPLAEDFVETSGAAESALDTAGQAEGEDAGFWDVPGRAEAVAGSQDTRARGEVHLGALPVDAGAAATIDRQELKQLKQEFSLLIRLDRARRRHAVVFVVGLAVLVGVVAGGVSYLARHHADAMARRAERTQILLPPSKEILYEVPKKHDQSSQHPAAKGSGAVVAVPAEQRPIASNKRRGSGRRHRARRSPSQQAKRMDDKKTAGTSDVRVSPVLMAAIKEKGAKAPAPSFAPKSHASPKGGWETLSLSGKLATKDIDKVLRHRKRAIARCAEKHHYYGKFSLQFTVGKDGGTSAVRVAPKDGHRIPAGMERCLRNLMSKLQFPPQAEPRPYHRTLVIPPPTL